MGGWRYYEARSFVLGQQDGQGAGEVRHLGLHRVVLIAEVVLRVLQLLVLLAAIGLRFRVGMRVQRRQPELCEMFELMCEG